MEKVFTSDTMERYGSPTTVSERRRQSPLETRLLPLPSPAIARPDIPSSLQEVPTGDTVGRGVRGI